MEASDLVCSNPSHEDSPGVITMQSLEQDRGCYEQCYRELNKEESERRLERETRDRGSLERERIDRESLEREGRDRGSLEREERDRGSLEENYRLQSLEEDKGCFEQRYRLLTREKEESERRLDREIRDRETLEEDCRLQLEERLCSEQKFDEVSGAMAKYERELSLLRNENCHLKTQFSQLRSVVSGREMTGGAVHVGIASGSFTDHVVTGSGGTMNCEMYREEVAILSHENELFKQIIEIIERQSQFQVEENSQAHVHETSEQIMWLKVENSKLEERVREIEKSAREQEMLAERERERAEEDVRKLKREVQILRGELEKETQDVGECESQITEMKLRYEEELHDMQGKLDSEISLKCQLQEQVHLLELNIRALEEERKILLDKIEVAYKKEDEVACERREIEESFSQDVCELEVKLDQAIQERMEALAEVERLTNELQVATQQLVQVEEAYALEVEEIRLRFEAEKEALMLHGRQKGLDQADIPGGSPVWAGPAYVDDWHVKLEQEVTKSKTLEKENKQLLYQINKLLSGDRDMGKDEGERSVFVKDKEGSNKVHALEEELSELHEKCRVLERDARKKKEYENKTKELMEEIDGLMSTKEEMARKQKELMRAAENSSSSVEEVEVKNRRLEEQVDSLSRKLRDLEDSHNKRGSASEVNDLKWENENTKRKTDELQKNTEILESKLKEGEQQLRELKSTKERLEQEATRNEHRYNREIDMERFRTESLKQELQKMSENLKDQAKQFEKSLEERKKLHEEHQKTLADEKQRLKHELEGEKESLRRQFEGEKQAIHQRVSQIESRLQEQGFSVQDVPWPTGGTAGQGLGSLQSKQSAVSLRQEVATLRATNEELEGKVRDLERTSRREVEELLFKHQQETAKLRGETEESSRERLEGGRKLGKEGGVRVSEDAMNAMIQSLKREVCVARQERERAIITLRNERRNFEARDSANYETMRRIKAECEGRVRHEEEKGKMATTELRRKISIAESRVAEMEAKHREEFKSLEGKYEQQRTELEKMVEHTERQVRNRLQIEHEARLNEERSRYDVTLKGLRREISALQEQRKQIQLKLKSTDVLVKGSTKELRYSKGMHGKLDSGSVARWKEEKLKLDQEPRIKDLEQEVQLLKREKAEIKASYRQEKAQIQAEFEEEKQRFEVRHKKERDEFRRRLDASHLRVMVVNDGKETLSQQKMIMQQQSSSVLESQRTELESEIGSMKNRLDDLEARQRQRAASQHKKDTQPRKLRFSSPERETRSTYFDDNGQLGRSSAFKRYHSSVDLRGLGPDTLSEGNLIGSSGSSGARRHSSSVNFPLTRDVSQSTGLGSGRFLAKSSSAANFRSSGILGASGSSLRRHTSSMELRHVGSNASHLNRVPSPVMFSTASFPANSSQYGFLRSAGLSAGGTRYRTLSGGLSSQGNLSISSNGLTHGGSILPRNQVLFQEVHYLPSVGILGSSAGSFRGLAGGHGAFSCYKRLSKAAPDPAASSGLSSGASKADDGAAASEAAPASGAGDTEGSVTEDAKAKALVLSGQKISSSSVKIFTEQLTTSTPTVEVQQAQEASGEISASELDARQKDVTQTSTE